MAVYRKVKRVSDLDLLSKVISDAQVLLAVGKENWRTTLGSIDQQKIERIEQTVSNEDGMPNTINLIMKDKSVIRLVVRNGETGDKGKTGKTGERGDKGDTAPIDTSRSENFLMVVNDFADNDETKVLSAAKGVELNDAINKLTETYLTDDHYQLLFNNLVFMEAEFVSLVDDEEVTLINTDTSDHKLYIKYWTYESDGSSEYFVYNDFANTYDSLNADLWDDIYLGATSGYFVATNAQLSDGNELFVLNRKDNTYDKVTIDDANNKDFNYYLSDADCNVSVHYDSETKTYDYNLVATELLLNIYEQVSASEYIRVTKKEDVDLSGFTMYYEYIDGEYVVISNIEKYLEKKAIRYYVKEGENWKEVESISATVTDNFQEYIEVEYTKVSNTNIFRHYVPISNFFETYYETYVGTLTNYSISFYIYDELREYYTRRLTEITPGVWDYVYTKINIPYWVDCEYITDTEDQTILLLYSDKEQSEIETITPVYINSIEFEDSTVEIVKGSVKNIDVNISPANVNVTDMILEYDDSFISIYEDGRIAAAVTDAVTTETIIKLSSEHNPDISDTVNVKIVTPITEIKLDIESLELYPGNTKQVNYTTVPAEVTTNKVKWSVSNNEMIKVSDTGFVELVKNADGEYTTGKCKLICTADDGYNAKTEIEVLVAIPVESVEITSKNKAFIDMQSQLVVNITPENATQKGLVYSSSDPDIITIDANTGAFMPKAKGSAILTATSTDGTNLSDSITMNVFVGVEKIAITGIDERLDIDLTNEYEVTLTPENPDNNEITIVVSDPSIIDYTEPVLVDGTTNKYRGTITAKSGGTVNIAFIANDGTGTGAAIDTIVTIPITDISFENTTLSVFVGEMVALQPVIGPADATNINEQLIWSSSNDAVATVDSAGRINALKAGQTTISATTSDTNAVMASCVIKVNVKCTDLTINDGNESINIVVGNSTFIDATVSPTDASNQFIEWIIEDNTIASINEHGVLEALSIGSTVITAVTTDGSNISKSLTVNVIDYIIDESGSITEENTEAVG